MKKITLLISLMLLNIAIGVAQDLRNAVWYGSYQGFDFNTNQPVELPQLPNGTYYSSAPNGFTSVCDANGNPILATNGIKVYAKNSTGNFQILTGQLKGLQYWESFLQNTIIVPKPKHSDCYYIFTINGDKPDYLNNIQSNQGLYYSEVNLSSMTIVNINTPLLTSNSVPIDASFGNRSNAITAIPADDGINYWVVATIQNNDYNFQPSLFAYKVGENGIENNGSPDNSYLLNYNYSDPAISATSIKISPEITPGTRRIACGFTGGELFLGNFHDGAVVNYFDETMVDNSRYYAPNDVRSVEFSENGRNLFYLQGTGYRFSSAPYEITETFDPIIGSSIFNTSVSCYNPQATSLQRNMNNQIIISGYGEDIAYNGYNGYNISYIDEFNNGAPYAAEAPIENSVYNIDYTAMQQLVPFQPCTPSFNTITPICYGEPLSPLSSTSLNGISGTWSPALNNTLTTTYTFTPDSGQQCSAKTSLSIVVNQKIVPTFDLGPIQTICRGSYNPLLTISKNGITGTWSPNFNNAVTTTYTFTPNPGQCATTTTITLSIRTPEFDSVAPICSGSTLNPLPTTSLDGATGSWSPALSNTTTTTYIFTPSSDFHCIGNTTMTITVNPKTIPTFSQIADICLGSIPSPLPTTSPNGITGTWSPALNNTTTTTYTFTPNVGQCATTKTMTVWVDVKSTPTFNIASSPSICAGDILNPLPTVSTNYTHGTWSPPLNNMSTTTYTFTPDLGQCANATTKTIVVNPLPTFNEVAMLNNGMIDYTLPAISSNNIQGTWNPPTIIEGTNDYTFTPYPGVCPITKTYTLMNLNTDIVTAVNDDFTSTPFNNQNGGTTPSVFLNDTIKIDGINTTPNSNNATFSIIKKEPSWYYGFPTINPNGTIYFPPAREGDGAIGPFYKGVATVTYKIVSKSCTSNYSIATVNVLYQGAEGVNLVGKHVQGNDAQNHTDKITVFPNPSNGIFNIDLTNVQGEYDTVEVYNMLGSKVYENLLISKDANSIDLSNMAVGCYLAKISGKSGNESFQLIKQ